MFVVNVFNFRYTSMADQQIVCYNCGGRGHRSIECPSAQTSNRCTRCNKAVLKSLVCWDCVTKSNGAINPKIYVPANDSSIVTIDDSDDEFIAPSKLPRVFGAENCHSLALYTTSNSARPGPASRTGPVNLATLVERIKTEPVDRFPQVTPVEQNSGVEQNRPAVPNSEVERTPRAGITYISLAQMDRMAIQSVILRDAANWPGRFKEYRMKIELNDGPITGQLRVMIMANDDPTVHQPVNENGNSD